MSTALLIRQLLCECNEIRFVTVMKRNYVKLLALVNATHSRRRYNYTEKVITYIFLLNTFRQIRMGICISVLYFFIREQLDSNDCVIISVKKLWYIRCFDIVALPQSKLTQTKESSKDCVVLAYYFNKQIMSCHMLISANQGCWNVLRMNI